MTSKQQVLREKWSVQLRVLSIENNLNTNFITLTIPIHPWLLFTGFVVLCQQSVISRCSFQQEKKIKDLTLSLEWEILNKKSAIFEAHLINISIKRNHINLKIVSQFFHLSVNISKFQLVWSFLDWDRILSRMFKTFFDCSQFIVFWASDEFFSFQDNSMCLILFLVWKSMSRCGTSQSSFFELTFLLLDLNMFRQLDNRFRAFFGSWYFYSPFALKNVTNLKKCSVVRRILTCSFKQKEFKISHETEMRKILQ